MQKRGIWVIWFLILGVLAVGTPLRAQGGDEGQPPLYVYVSQWAVPRAQWADMAKLGDEDRALEQKLLADGTITSYGEGMNLIHAEGEPTHVDWFTATSEGNILKALEAFYARQGVTAPVRAASKHWDYFLVSRIHNERSGKYEGGYLTGIAWDVKPGQDRAFLDLVKSRLVPVLEKLLADGVLIFYGVSVENFHKAPPGHYEVVLATTDASGVDKVSQAFEAAFAKDATLGPAMRALTKGESHRDFLLRVTGLTIK
jgi:hypothetical protein